MHEGRVLAERVASCIHEGRVLAERVASCIHERLPKLPVCELRVRGLTGLLSATLPGAVWMRILDREFRAFILCPLGKETPEVLQAVLRSIGGAAER
jgi:hypothetical protein